ncbi:MFS transporter [uncultured Clostridium sp.]|uniref:MFS transporter n=1 Tax=uncultured Clostridium sp. TaxID=59620 RepID=UPI0025D784BD|nr:MFS transporter [uncultured Clostridium sp.]MDU4884190.1 MFS transporter [Clostridium celatum]MDU7077399.1 MFS transporter [Clostridium celatum]
MEVENTVKSSKNDISMKTLISFGMGSLGNNIICAMIGTYLTIYLTDSFGIGAAAVGTLFLIARIIDAITDPIMGVIVDNTKSKMGKSRPYLLVVPIFMGISTIMCFSSPNLSESGKIIWIYISYILWGICFTAMDTPYWSLSANITQSAQGRTKIITSARTIAFGGSLVVSVFTLPLVAKFGNWTTVAVLYSITAAICTWITVWGVREINVDRKPQKQGLKQLKELFKTNKPLRILLISMLMLEITYALRNGFSIYYIKYNFNAESYIPVVTGISIVSGMIGGICTPNITKKLGKRKTALIGIGINGLGFLSIFLLKYSNLTLMLAINTIMGIAEGAANISLASMVADCVEYGEWKTGKRSEGMIFSSNIFKTKLASAIGGALCGYVLAFVGYKANSVQTISTLNGMHVMYSLIPGIIAIFSIISLRRYNLTEKEYEAILEDLNNGEYLEKVNSN